MAVSDHHASPWDLLVEMGAELAHNPLAGGFYIASFTRAGEVHLQATDACPETAVRRLYDRWVAAGRPAWRPYTEEEQAQSRAWCRQQDEWRAKGQGDEAELPFPRERHRYDEVVS